MSAAARREMDVGGGRVAWREAGEGPPVVLVHGSPLHGGCFRHAIAALADRFRVLAVDVPGFGDSTPAHDGAAFVAIAARLAAWLRRLDLGPTHLVGHDWGGPIAVGAAARAELPIARLILVNTTLDPDFRPPRYWRPAIAPVLGELLVVRAGLVGWALPALMRAAWRRDVRARYAPSLARPGTRRTILALERLEGFEALLREIDAALPSMTSRAAVIWGHPDPYFRPPAEARLAARFAHVSVTDLRGAGHFPQEDAPAAFSAALLDALG